MNTEGVFNRKEKFNLFLYLFSRGFLSFGDSIYSFAISFFIVMFTLPNTLIMRSKKEMDDILTIEKDVTESLVME